MRLMRFGVRTASRDRPVGKGRVRVNPSPGFVGDRGCAGDLHARRPKGLSGLNSFKGFLGGHKRT